MTRRLQQVFHPATLLLAALLWVAAIPLAQAAPKAELVMDMRTGEVIHASNADTRLHPASLTKMMTLYVAFEAVRNGEISLDTMVTISRKAASEPPSKLGLREGQRIELRYLIRAAAIKSANDAATAIGEAVAGSEAAFARRMNRTAAAIGMTRTHFKNAHGLTESGHLSTARDMTLLGRQLFFDYPDYYHLFKRRTIDVPGRTVANTNRRFLAAYRGADGIKTGYTNAAGFNLVASAQRGPQRVIATMFGGSSTQARNDRVAALLDLGFRNTPTRVATHRPGRPGYVGPEGKITRVVRAPERSIRPLPKPWSDTPAVPSAPSEAQVLALTAGIDAAVESLGAVDVAAPAAPVATPPAPLATEIAANQRPRRNPLHASAPEVTRASAAATALSVLGEIAEAAVDVVARSETALVPTPAPALETPEAPKTPGIILDTVAEVMAEPAEAEVVNRISTSGGRHWGITVGQFTTRDGADRMLIRTALAELATLGEALRKVKPRAGKFDANFVGLTHEGAALACRRLAARGTACEVFGPPA